MSLHRTIHHPNGGYTVEMLHRSSGMVVQVEHGPTGRYLRQTAHTGLHDIESLEEWDRRKPPPKPTRAPEPLDPPGVDDTVYVDVTHIRSVGIGAGETEPHAIRLADNEQIIGVTVESGKFMPRVWIATDPEQETS